MKVDAVIIDSGVNNLLSRRIIDGINLSGVGDKDDIHDNIGHGSSVLNLILTKSPNASVYMIKVCNDYNGFSFDKLCAALEYIISADITCKILNISMGIIRLDNYSRLHDLVTKIRDKGMVIVSAYSNQGIISYPAGFEEVIGVDSSTLCLKRDEFEFVDDSVVNIRASSSYFHAFDADERKILASGSSYATANLTGILLQHTINYKGDDYYNYCLQVLRKTAIRLYTTTDNCYHTHDKSDKSNCYLHNHDKVDLQEWKSFRFLTTKPKAVVFPFNKEIHSMARFETMLELEVMGFYDYRISLNNNKNIRDIIGKECHDRIVNSITELDWTSEFELFVCGHCNEAQSITHNDILRQIIDNCLKFNKKLYCFDDPRPYLTEVSNNVSENFFYPHIDKANIKPNRFDKLRKSSKPVVGVYGTSSKQGKYTLQLYLRKFLKEKGFRVGELGTEPHGYLFGFDFVYPMGYNSSVSVDKNEAVKVLNEAIWEIEMKDPDIIITGCQSSTVPYNVNIIANLNFTSYEFLIGTAPDAAILCVNPFDSVSYIKKSIKFIESVGNATVIALVLFPVDRSENIFIDRKTILKKEELQQKINFLYSNTGIKTYLNNSFDAAILSDDIVHFFS